LVILVLIFYRMYMDRYAAVDIYVIALFAAEVILGLGHVISLKWVIEGEVKVGTFCTVQGLLRQLGDVGVALATLAIAVQTFVTIWWVKHPQKSVAFISVGIQWTMAIFLAAIPYGLHTKPPSKYYATPTPYWCWIGQGFTKDRIADEYFWFWLTLFVSIVLYLLLFLFQLGFIKPGTSWYAPKCKPEQTPAGLWTVIWYPIVYCVMIMPLSIVRWVSFKQVATFGTSHISPVATFTVSTILGLSGFWDAMLYLLTRAWIFQTKREDKPQAPGPPADMENGFESLSTHSGLTSA